MKIGGFHKKVPVRLGILLGMMLISVMIVQKVQDINHFYAEQRDQKYLKKIQEELQQQGVVWIPPLGENAVFTVSASPLGNKEIRNGADVKIDWWRNEEDGKYYLFLPAFASGNPVRVNMNIVSEIYLDGEKIENGEDIILHGGSHEITTDYDEQVFWLEVLYSSRIPSLYFENYSGTLQYLHTDKSNHENGMVTILREDGSTDMASAMEDIHCRGNASWTDTEKKSYQVEFLGDVSLLGMPAGRKWILIANAFDNTLIRNTTAFHIAEELNIPHTPKMEYVDVYANGAYIGNYLLTEKVEVGENRVPIRNLEKEMLDMNPGVGKLKNCSTFMTPQGRLFSTKGYEIPREPSDISGGYLLEIEMSDRYGLEPSGFITSRMQPVVLASPKYASFNQVSYIANRYQDFEDAIYSEDGYSPYTGVHFTEYIDLDSFARKYIFEEVVKNLDAAFTSQYLYKPSDNESTKFFAGPVWDYDKAIAGRGITEAGIDLFDPQGFYVSTQTKDSDIWYGLYQHEQFRQEAIRIYQQELHGVIVAETRGGIQNRALRVADASVMDAFRWNVFHEETTGIGKRNAYYAKVTELIHFLKLRDDFLRESWGI